MILNKYGLEMTRQEIIDALGLEVAIGLGYDQKTGGSQTLERLFENDHANPGERLAVSPWKSPNPEEYLADMGY